MASSKRPEEEDLRKEVSLLREENAILKGMLEVLRVDLQVKDDQIDKLFRALKTLRTLPTTYDVSSALDQHSSLTAKQRHDAKIISASRTEFMTKMKSVEGVQVQETCLIKALNDDVLCRILSYLDVLSNLSIRRTCTRLNSLSRYHIKGYWEDAWRALRGCVPVSPFPGALASSAQWKQEMRWCQVGSRPVVTTMFGHEGSVTSLALAEHNEREFLVSGSDDGSLIVWSISEDRARDDDSRPVIMQHHHRQSKSENVSRLHSLSGHHGAVWGVSVDGSAVCSGSCDGTVKVWDLLSGNCRHTLRGHENWISCVSMSKGLILSGSWDSTVRLWHVAGPNEAGFLGSLPTEQGNSVYSLDRYSNLVATGSDRHRFELFDLVSRQMVRRVDQAHAGKTYSVHFQSADVMATGGSEGKVRIWDMRSNSHAPMVDLASAHTKPVMTVKMGREDWAPFRVASCSMDHLVKVFDTRMAGKPIEELPSWIHVRGKKHSGETAFQAHSGAVFALCMDANKICSGGADRAIKVFRF